MSISELPEFPPALQVFAEHRTIRFYADEPLADGDLDLIIEAGRRAPTDAQGHMYSFVRITDPAVIAATTLSSRYIADRHLPRRVHRRHADRGRRSRRRSVDLARLDRNGGPSGQMPVMSSSFPAKRQNEKWSHSGFPGW